MNPQLAHTIVLKTLQILSPGDPSPGDGPGDDDPGAVPQWPRRIWFLIATGALAASFLLLLIVSGVQTNHFAAMALNDDLSFYGRIVLILSGLVLGPWRTKSRATSGPASSSARSWSERRGNAGRHRQRAGVPVRGARAGEHADVPAALPEPPDGRHPRIGDEVLLPEHLLFGPCSLALPIFTAWAG